MAEKKQLLTTQLFIKVEGAEPTKEVMQNLLEVVVEQHVHLPDMFTMRFLDVKFEVMDGDFFEPGKSVEIMANDDQKEKVLLIKGEITALEPAFVEGMNAELMIRGYDKTHQLFREVKSKAYLNKKDSDLAEEIAGNVGLAPEIDSTTTVYEHIYQHNQSDLAFLMHRAWRIGYECFVEDEKLYFRKPPTGKGELEIYYGQDLLSFYPRITMAEQVKEVTVRGWNIEQVEPIIGKASASAGSLYPEVPAKGKQSAWDGKFGTSKLVIVDQPVVDQAEADILAKARLDELSGAFIQADGTAFRRPHIRAGKMLDLKGLGKRLSGTYLVTSATHRYEESGLTTDFTVQGARTGTLAEHLSTAGNKPQWGGAVPAIVTNADDPKSWGRVKVQYPWMSEEAESDWARVISVGGGPEAGMFAMPAVGDEVLVIFAYSDFNYPYILGGLWNGKNATPPDMGSGGEQPLVRTIRSRTGHMLTMHDNADNKVSVETAGGHVLTFDDTNKNITIKTSGGHEILLDDSGSAISIKSTGNLTIEGGQNVEVKATANMKLQANGNVDIQASGQLNLKGAMINLN